MVTWKRFRKPQISFFLFVFYTRLILLLLVNRQVFDVKIMIVLAISGSFNLLFWRGVAKKSEPWLFSVKKKKQYAVVVESSS